MNNIARGEGHALVVVPSFLISTKMRLFVQNAEPNLKLKNIFN